MLPKVLIRLPYLVQVPHPMKKLAKLEWVNRVYEIFWSKELSNFVFLLVTTKVTQGAKTFGSFLYSAVNKAGAKIKESVKDNVRIIEKKLNLILNIFYWSTRAFWVNSVKNRRHLSRDNRVEPMRPLHHGLAIPMNLKSKMKF